MNYSAAYNSVNCYKEVIEVYNMMSYSNMGRDATLVYAGHGICIPIVNHRNYIKIMCLI